MDVAMETYFKPQIYIFKVPVFMSERIRETCVYAFKFAVSVLSLQRACRHPYARQEKITHMRNSKAF